jgi:hypothetical protein
MRIQQGKATRGSQHLLQNIVNQKPEVLSDIILSRCPKRNSSPIKWLCPLREDHYSEYQDGSFLECLGLERHIPELKNFWPSKGPVWDGLGKNDNTYFLVEAKANIPEILSDCKATSPLSLALINKSLSETQNWLKTNSRIDWTKCFYQYANRLAHLYFLTQIIKVKAYLVNIYFVADKTHISTEKTNWETALELQKKLMGLSAGKLKGKVIECFLDV